MYDMYIDKDFSKEGENRNFSPPQPLSLTVGEFGLGFAPAGVAVGGDRCWRFAAVASGNPLLVLALTYKIYIHPEV